MTIKFALAKLFFKLDSAYQRRKFNALENIVNTAAVAQDAAGTRQEQAEIALHKTTYAEAAALMEQENANIDALRNALERAVENAEFKASELAAKLDDADARLDDTVILSPYEGLIRPAGLE